MTKVVGRIGLSPKEENPRPVIQIDPADFENEVTLAEEHLIDNATRKNRGLYQQGGKIVQTGSFKRKNPDGEVKSDARP